MSKYRTNFVKGRNGQTIYAVEEYYPEENEWGIVKVFTTRKAAEEYKQTLEAYGKEKIIQIFTYGKRDERACKAERVYYPES